MDPLTGQWVILAAKRAGRPNEFRPGPPPGTDPAGCPFCPGHEDRTTPEILATGRPADGSANGPGWRLRLFPNMYPALGPAGTAAAPSDLFPAAPGQGRHEVLVLTPDHDGDLASLPPDGLVEILSVVRDRAAALAADPQVAHVLPFVNQGPEAGATLGHPHLQILGSSRVPELSARKAARLADWRREKGSCLVCDTLAAEQAQGTRWILANDRWTAHAPWAARFPFEVRLAPRACQRDITDAGADDLADLAALLGGVMSRLRARHGDFSFNVVIHLAGRDSAHFHWHLDVLPRLTRLAGFEAGTGFAINSVTPESAADELRGLGE